jgi:putative endonuclease
MYYVYLLKSEKDGGFYVGSSGDLKIRKKDHDEGFVKSTRHRRPLVLIYYESYLGKLPAEDRERQLKKFGSAYNALLKRLKLK